jgi:tripartite ATP-independent transporter DctP family solute receptor
MDCMNKTIGALGALLLLLLVVVGIRLFESGSQGLPDNQPQSKVERDGPLELHLGHNINTETAMHAAAERFAEEVAERSEGRVKVVIHPNQELGNDHKMLEMARHGELDMLLTPTAKLSLAVPEMQYADLPFFFSSQEELYRMLDGPPGDALLKRLTRIDLVGAAFWVNGFKQFTANRPLHRPEDFADTRFRIMKSRLLVEQFNALGATPVPIDFHATRQALADGAVDGQENPLVAIVAMGFHEVQSDLTISNHAFLGYVFSISGKVYQQLPTDIRQILVDTAKGLSAWQRQETKRRETRFLEQIKAAGVEIHTLTEAERAAFEARLATLPDRFEEVIGPDLLAKTRELRWRALPASAHDKEWLIGLDADLSTASWIAGMAIRRGAQLAIEQINANGGLLGKPLRLLALDHQGVPARSIANLEQFAQIPNLLAVIGGKQGHVIGDALDTIQRLKIPYLIPWAAPSHLIQYDQQPNYLFRCSAADQFVTPYLLDQATANGKRTAMLLERSIWGRSNEAAAKKWQEAGGEGLVAIEWFNRGQEAFAYQIQKLIADGAQNILFVANPRESVHIVKAMAARPDPLPLYSHWGLTGGKFWQDSKESLARVDLQFIQTMTLAPKVPERARPLLEQYHQQFGGEPEQWIPAPAGTLHAFDLVKLLALAVEQAQSAAPPAVRDALEEIEDYPGVVSHYRYPFAPHRHDALDASNLELARFDDQGRIVGVETR